jgi:hypothetical protein
MHHLEFFSCTFNNKYFCVDMIQPDDKFANILLQPPTELHVGGFG